MTRAALRVTLVLASIMTMSAAACPGRKQAAAKPGAKSVIPDSADQVLFGSSTMLTDQGVAKGRLLSDTAYMYEDGTRLELRQVNVTFFTGQGVKDGTLTSRAGTYNSRLQRLEARGDVIVAREGGRRLTTPRLVYDQARNQIFSDTAFTLVEPARQISGIAFETDPRLTRFNCLRACKVVAPVAVPTR